MRTFKTTLFLLSLFLLFLCSAAFATTREVGPNSPYATPAAAYMAAQPGDTILIHAGVYPCSLNVTKADLTFTSAPGEQVTLQYANPVAQYGMIFWLLARGTTIQNLTLDGQYTGQLHYCYYCVKAEGASAPGTVISNCTIKNAADALVKGAAPVNASSSTNPGLSLNIDGCTIYKEPTTPELRSEWTAIDSLMPGTVVTNCTIHDVDNGISFKGGVTGCQAMNNVIYNVKYGGIWIGAYDNGYVYNVAGANPFFQSTLGSTVEGNTLTNCVTYGIVFMGSANATVTGNTLISCGQKSAAVWIAPNMYWTSAHQTYGHNTGVVFQNNVVDEASGIYQAGNYNWQRPAVDIVSGGLNVATKDYGVWSGNTYSAEPVMGLPSVPLFWDFCYSPYISAQAGPNSPAPPTVTDFAAWQKRYGEAGSKIGPVPVIGTPTPTGAP